MPWQTGTRHLVHPPLQPDLLTRAVSPPPQDTRMSVVVDQSQGPLGMNMNGMQLMSVEPTSASYPVLQECLDMTLTHVADVPVFTGQEVSAVLRERAGRAGVKLTFARHPEPSSHLHHHPPAAPLGSFGRHTTSPTRLPPANNPPSSPRSHAGETDTFAVPKSAAGEIGICFDETIVQNVVPGSTADMHGATRHVGRVVTHVNGTPVYSLNDICAAAARATMLHLQFLPHGAPRPHPHQQPLSPMAKALRSLTPPRPSPSPPRRPASPTRWTFPEPPAQPQPPQPQHPVVVIMPPTVPAGQVPAQQVVHYESPVRVQHVLPQQHVMQGYPQGPPPMVAYSPQTHQQPLPPPQAPVPMAQASSYELVINKNATDPLGLRLVGMTLVEVLPGSSADHANSSRFVGMQLTHVNGEPVSSMSALETRKGLTRVSLRFTDVSVNAFEAVLDKVHGEPLGMFLNDMFLEKIQPNSAASRAGFERFLGRRLVEINGTKVFTPDEVRDIYTGHPDGRLVLRFEKSPEEVVPGGGSPRRGVDGATLQQQQEEAAMTGQPAPPSALHFFPPPGTLVRTTGLTETHVIRNGEVGVVVEDKVVTQEGETVIHVEFPQPGGRRLVRRKNLELLDQHQPQPGGFVPASPVAASPVQQVHHHHVVPVPASPGGDVFDSPVRRPPAYDARYSVPIGSPFAPSPHGSFIPPPHVVAAAQSGFPSVI